jgi:hypothetical protein
MLFGWSAIMALLVSPPNEADGELLLKLLWFGVWNVISSIRLIVVPFGIGTVPLGMEPTELYYSNVPMAKVF